MQKVHDHQILPVKGQGIWDFTVEQQYLNMVITVINQYILVVII